MAVATVDAALLQHAKSRNTSLGEAGCLPWRDAFAGGPRVLAAH